ncbi:MAG: hypothetical protein JXR59_02570 [Desulfuromonadaceae bacterium]|nr:hypothetical protein [Desulfuromonadaceae bacterium]
MTKPSFPCTTSVVELSTAFDDLLFSLSALQRLGELAVYDLDKAAYLQQFLAIAHDVFSASTSLIYRVEQDEEAGLNEVMALDGQQPLHWRSPTSTEATYLQLTREALPSRIETAGHMHEFRSDQFPCDLISAALFSEKKLIGILMVQHPLTVPFNLWEQRLIRLFCLFAGQQLALCAE